MLQGGGAGGGKRTLRSASASNELWVTGSCR